MEKRNRNQIEERFYRPPSAYPWLGREDGPEPAQRRWHQHIQLLDLTATSPATVQTRLTIVLLGFACDEGVKRNRGRPGASRGPEAIRKALCNLPLHHPDLPLYDAGDILCPAGELKRAQQQLAAAVSLILRSGAFPILLGGGHEITYGHWHGISTFLKSQSKGNLGLINFDAHFDNRKITPDGATSGTGFWQIAADCYREGSNFRYLALGIQEASNTLHLFETARLSNTQYALAGLFDDYDRNRLNSLIEPFLETVERLYVTIDLDVFASPYAPGVSATAYNGIRPDAVFFDILRKIISTGKLISLDIAELNPDLDIDNRTAKLTATIIFHTAAYLWESRR